MHPTGPIWWLCLFWDEMQHRSYCGCMLHLLLVVTVVIQRVIGSVYLCGLDNNC